MGVFDIYYNTTEPAQEFQDKLIKELKSITSKITNMGKEIDDIKKSNAETKASLQNIAADIVALDAKIASATTLEELEALKAESADLAANAASIAGIHPDIVTGGGETGGGGTEPGTGGGTEPGTGGGTEPGTEGGGTEPV